MGRDEHHGGQGGGVQEGEQGGVSWGELPAGKGELDVAPRIQRGKREIKLIMRKL
jgi:hypothetical protein